MELFKVNATIEKLHSEKKGTDYLVVRVPLASDYTLTYFPKDAEKAIINRSDFLSTAKTDLDTNTNTNTSNISNTSVFDNFV